MSGRSIKPHMCSRCRWSGHRRPTSSGSTGSLYRHVSAYTSNHVWEKDGTPRCRAALHGVGLASVRRKARLEAEAEAGYPIGEPCLATKEHAEGRNNGAHAYVRGDGDCQIAALRSHEDASASRRASCVESGIVRMHGSLTEGREKGARTRTSFHSCRGGGKDLAITDFVIAVVNTPPLHQSSVSRS